MRGSCQHNEVGEEETIDRRYPKPEEGSGPPREMCCYYYDAARHNLQTPLAPARPLLQLCLPSSLLPS